MACPNLSDPIIKKQFEDLKSRTNENTAYNLWDQYNGDLNEINRRLNIKETYKASVPLEIKPVNNIRDFINNFFSKKYRMPKLDEMDEDHQTDYIYNKMLGNYNDGAYHYGSYSINDLTRTKGLTEIKSWIRDNIVNDLKLSEAHLSQNLNDFNTALKAGKDIMNAAEEAFGAKHKYNYDTLKDLAYYMRYNDPVKEIINYKDLKTHSDPVLRKLYNESFEGMNPKVIIHNIEGNKVDLSLIDATRYYLGDAFVGEKPESLMNGYDMKSNEWYDKGGSNLSDSPGNARKALLAMQVMAMKDANPEIYVRNLGALQINDGKITPFMIDDLNMFMKDMKIMAGSDKFKISITDPNIKKILTDPNLLDGKYNQSFLTMLQQSLKEASEDKGNRGRVSYEEQYKYLMTDGLTKGETADALKRMIRNYEKYWADDKDMLQKDPYYQLLGFSLKETLQGSPGSINRVTDISHLAGKIIPIYWQQNDLVQSLAYETMNAKVMLIDQFKKVRREEDAQKQSFDSMTENMVKRYKSKNFDTRLAALVSDKGSEYFEHLFKKVDAIADYDSKEFKKGDKVQVNDRRRFHYTLDDPATKDLFDRGKLSKEDIKYTNRIIDMIENEIIEHDMHNRRMNGDVTWDGKDKFTREEVLQNLIKQGYEKGTLPIISKSLNELLMAGKFKDFWEGFGDKMNNYEKLFDDEKFQDKDLDKISTTITNILNKDKQLQLSGLREEHNPDGTTSLYLTNMEDNSKMTSNMEKIMTYSVLGSMRKRIYEDRVVPVFNSYNTIINAFEKSKIKLTETKNLLNTYFQKTVHNHIDDPNTTADILGMKINLKWLTRASVGAITFGNIAWSIPVAAKRLLFGEFDTVVRSLAVSLANKTGTEQYFMPSVEDQTKAAIWIGQNFGDALRLADQYQAFNYDSEKEFARNFLLKKTDSNLLQTSSGMTLTHAAFMMTKLQGLIAYLIKDGSLDAHSFTKDGKLIYDQKQDRRFYDKNGNLTEQGQVFLKDQTAQQKDYGMMDKNATTLSQGYHAGDITRMQAYGKMLIGALDEYTRNQLGNQWYWSIATQYRTFTFTKAAQLGLFNTPFKSTIIRILSTERGEDGKLIPKLLYPELEGQIQSVNKGVKALFSLKKDSFTNFWKDASSQTRVNLGETAIKTAVALGLMFMAGTVWADQKKKDEWSWKQEAKFSWIYSDLMTSFMMAQIIENPFPIYNQLHDLIRTFPHGTKMLEQNAIGKDVKLADEAIEGDEEPIKKSRNNK